MVLIKRELIWVVDVPIVIRRKNGACKDILLCLSVRIGVKHSKPIMDYKSPRCEQERSIYIYSQNGGFCGGILLLK